MARSKQADPLDILATAITMVPVDSVTRYPKNPRIGNMEVIKDSIRENGLFRPLIVQKSTNYVLDGNHTWQAARELGFTEIPIVIIDVDDKTAARMVLAANRANDLATYDSDLLAEVLKYVETPTGTGYSQDDFDALLEAIDYHMVEQIEDVIRPALTIAALDDDGARTAVVKNPTVAGPSLQERMEQLEEEDEEAGLLNTVDAQLQGQLQLSEETNFPSSNYFGIPDLAANGLLDKLPTPLDTWGGQEATPDDGVTHWVWNYGVAARKGLPGDRAILCFYTHDKYFEGWWDHPAFYTTKVLNMGIKTVVVPDFSFYDEFPTALHIYNTYRAQWLGRFFQEAGLKVIPRLQFALGDGGKSLDFCMAGIPVNPPTLASSIQNVNDKEQFKLSVDHLKKGLQALQPAQWLVYGGNPAVRHIEALDPVNKGLCGEVVHIYNYAHKRRGVVYDKAEGLAGIKKERNKRGKDPYAEPDPDIDPETTASRRSRARKDADEGATFEDE